MQISGHKTYNQSLITAQCLKKKHREISNILSDTRTTDKSHTFANPDSREKYPKLFDCTDKSQQLPTSVSTSLHNTTATRCCDSNFPTHRTNENGSTPMSHFSLSNSNQDLTSLFGGATLNVSNLNIYMR